MKRNQISSSAMTPCVFRTIAQQLNAFSPSDFNSSSAFARVGGNVCHFNHFSSSSTEIGPSISGENCLLNPIIYNDRMLDYVLDLGYWEAVFKQLNHDFHVFVNVCEVFFVAGA